MVRPIIAGLTLLLALLTSATPAVAQQAPTPCAQLDGFHRLDFWLGQWQVHSGESLVGTSTIESILKGCAIMEHWRGGGGTEGKSLFFYDHVTDTWKQVWVTENATAPGGLKEKTLLPDLADGSLRFQGTVRLPDGRTFLDRTTLTPLEGDRVRQVIETSSDDGATWQTRFDAIYSRPKPEPDGGADKPGADIAGADPPAADLAAARDRRTLHALRLTTATVADSPHSRGRTPPGRG